MTDFAAARGPVRALLATHAGAPIRIVRLDGRMKRADDAGATVLVADAHEDSRAVCAMLLRHGGFAVLEAATGEEAIRLAHAHRPDAIVLGPVLRGVDGLRALEVLQQHPATETIPVVVLSSVSGDEHERRARAAGCAAYLLKPCTPADVLDAVRALTEVREAA
ncbi:MAG TPA: response regulator [Longimicrobium sp.]|nr:response regulator [Longimicrobium sp.]